jgi:integrase
MTDEEFRQLIEACGPGQLRLREILEFCYFTGARPIEVRTAQWSDLDLEHATITLKKHKTSKTRKDRAPRVIYLTEEVP